MRGRRNPQGSMSGRGVDRAGQSCHRHVVEMLNHEFDARTGRCQRSFQKRTLPTRSAIRRSRIGAHGTVEQASFGAAERLQPGLEPAELDGAGGWLGVELAGRCRPVPLQVAVEAKRSALARQSRGTTNPAAGTRAQFDDQVMHGSVVSSRTLSRLQSAFPVDTPPAGRSR